MLTRTAQSASEDDSLDLRVLALLGGLGLWGFEIIYAQMGEPTGPFWLRASLISICIGFYIVTQFLPKTRGYCAVGAGILAILITAENTYRVHLLNFTLSHSIPMLVVVVGASYAFRNQKSMALYLIASAVGLTIAMMFTPDSEVSAPIYIGTVWVCIVLTLIVFGTRVEEHNRVKSHDRLLNNIFDASHGGLILIQQNQIREANDRAHEVLGTNSLDELYQLTNDALTQHYELPSDAVLHDCLAGSSAREQIHVNTHDKSLWLDVHLRRLELEDHEMLLVSFYDITAVVDGQRELIEAKNDAERALEVRGSFLANMSHEIRTPMNGIIGMTSLLLTSDLNDEQKDQINTIKHSSETLLHLINDILDYSKIDAAKMVLELRTVNLASIFNNIHELLRLHAEDKGIYLKFEYSPDLPEELTADSTRIEQVVQNLVNNAIKFTSEGGVTVKLSGRWQRGNRFLLEIAVIDTGIGIAASKVDNLFEAFIQADSSTTRKFGGTGLGLSITKGLVDLMSGAISVDSSQGHGTTITVKLPLDAPILKLNEIPDGSESDASITTLSPLKVLVAEDNLVNQKVAGKMLEKLGIHADLVEDGQQAINAAEQQDFDLILMDVQMPEVDGLDATKHIRSLEQPQPVVIALTANAMKSDQDTCLEVGMNDFLTKPLTLQALSAKILEHFPEARKTS